MLRMTKRNAPQSSLEIVAVQACFRAVLKPKLVDRNQYTAFFVTIVRIGLVIPLENVDIKVVDDVFFTNWSQFRRVVCIFVFITTVGGTLLSCSNHKVPQKLLLCSLTTPEQDISFACPSGDHFDLVIAFKKNNEGHRDGLKGSLLIKANSFTNSIVFDTRKCISCNWLHDDSLEEYAISLPADGKPINLDSQFKSGSIITISFKTTNENVESASIWLCYLK